MIEFGAGGTIQQNEDAPAETPGAAGAAGDAPDAAANTEQENAAATAAAAAAPTPAPRRKRKAKGWFCPVCRQRKWLLSSTLSSSLTLYPQPIRPCYASRPSLRRKRSLLLQKARPTRLLRLLRRTLARLVGSADQDSSVACLLARAIPPLPRPRLMLSAVEPERNA